MKKSNFRTKTRLPKTTIFEKKNNNNNNTKIKKNKNLN